MPLSPHLGLELLALALLSPLVSLGQRGGELDGRWQTTALPDGLLGVAQLLLPVLGHALLAGRGQGGERVLSGL